MRCSAAVDDEAPPPYVEPLSRCVYERRSVDRDRLKSHQQQRSVSIDLCCHVLFILVLILSASSSQGWLDMCHRYISLIYIGYFHSKISDIFDSYQVFLFFNVTRCDFVLIFSPCVLLAYY